MLKLPSVTLLGIDCVHPLKTIGAMIHSKRQVQFAKAVLVTDANDLEVRKLANGWGIELIHHISGSRFDYEWDMLEFTPDYFSTEFCLFQEWDAAVMNARAWTDAFLNYDYIGAPWVLHTVPGYPQCTEENRVGNGGFAIKSWKFCKEISKHVDRKNRFQVIHSDGWMCRIMREHMLAKGFKYAPWRLAELFSCEDKFYASEFGAHGDATIKMNNWNWNWFETILA